MPRDFNGATLAEVEDEIRFNKIRPSDHICCPFQCPNCQSQNIRDRNLISGRPSDEAFNCLVIRATIDAFWLHASKTISSHRSEVKFICKYADALDITHPFPRLGPFPLGHHMGMLQGITLEMRSMEPGKKREILGWGTSRKQCSTYTVI